MSGKQVNKATEEKVDNKAISEEKKEKLFSPIPYVPKTIEVRSLLEQTDKKYITVGKTLNHLVDAKNAKNGTTAKDNGYLLAQRDYSWSIQMASNLICSILFQRNINEILLFRKDSSSIYLKTIDGQQRITTIWKFVNNIIALNMKKATFSFFIVGGEKYSKDFLNGKYFKDLPEEWQELILSYSIRVIIYNNCTEEQARQIYVDIATGTKPLRSIEVRRALMNDEMSNLIDEFLEGSWTLHTMNSLAALGNRGIDIVTQFFVLVKENGDVKLDKDNIDRVMYEMRDSGISDEFKADILSTKQLLNNTFDAWIDVKKQEEKEKQEKKTKGRRITNFGTYKFSFVTNKTYTIMLIWAAYQAVKQVIDKDKFQQWAFRYFQKPSQKFIAGLADGKAKANDLKSVQLRVEAISDELEKLK